jgi:GT2 family glycosyltransferase
MGDAMKPSGADRTASAPARDGEPVDISFLVALHNCLPLTRVCLDSLRETVRGWRYEIVLVDDASMDGTRGFLATLAPPYRVLYNPVQCGFGASANRAARAARAPLLCFLNNDTVLSPRWLDPMVALLDEFPDVALVGNVQVSPRNGRIDHAGVFFDLRGHPERACQGRRRIPAGRWRAYNAVGAACWIVRRDTFLGAGGFDEAYRTGYEDVDLCVRLRLAGYRLLVSHDSVIQHHVASSPGRAAHDEANRERFLQQWSAITAAWGRDEWAKEYLRRYAGRWWAANPQQLVRAIRLLIASR